MFRPLESKIALDLKQKPTGAALKSKINAIEEKALEKAITELDAHLNKLVEIQPLGCAIFSETIHSLKINEEKMKQAPGMIDAIKYFLNWLDNQLQSEEAAKTKDPVKFILQLQADGQLYKKYYEAHKLTRFIDSSKSSLLATEFKTDGTDKPGLINEAMVSVLVKKIEHMAKLQVAELGLVMFNQTCCETYTAVQEKEFADKQLQIKLLLQLSDLKKKTDVKVFVSSPKAGCKA